MDACDVVIVGAGPAGSTCARDLRRRGVDVVLIDKARFPRDKVCAGWITPGVIDALQLNVEEYRQQRTLEAITGFRIGVIGDAAMCDVDYGRPVSYAIRRSEFDQYLVDCAGGARTGEHVRTIERRGGRWIVNDAIAAPMLVGAGGHRCPVARIVDDGREHSPVVAAAEIEVDVRGDGSNVVRDRPELFLARDLAGYGWCIRKGDYVNAGFGRVGGHTLEHEASEFLRFLRQTGRLPADCAQALRAHAYGLAPFHRSLVTNGALLVGDAASLAHRLSGEGIGPAVESARFAADAIVAADGDYRSERLQPYADAIEQRFGLTRSDRLTAFAVSSRLWTAAVRHLVTRPWFARHIVLDRWFLQRHERRRQRCPDRLHVTGTA
ncbi:MAG TPA: NAD(P)/FAD-dependent oxidoreductase [Vicinamibacterales bacterium]|nr:NAD(P)/FAD-dependent oxidoreductase [Vicinamibacterales bacterium]